MKKYLSKIDLEHNGKVIKKGFEVKEGSEEFKVLQSLIALEELVFEDSKKDGSKKESSKQE